MADRTSAALFATIFEMLARNPTEEHKAMAKELWPRTREYDFSDYQMGCDEALIILGLAEKAINPKYPDDGPVMFYGIEGHREP